VHGADAERRVLTLVTFAQQTATIAGAVLVLLIFVVAASEIGIAIPIVLLLSRQRRTLDVEGPTGSSRADMNLLTLIVLLRSPASC